MNQNALARIDAGIRPYIFAAFFQMNSDVLAIDCVPSMACETSPPAFRKPSG